MNRNENCTTCQAPADFAVSTYNGWTYYCDQCIVSMGWMTHAGTTSHHNHEMYLLAANNKQERIN